MSQEYIDYIKQELLNFEEIKPPFNIKTNAHIKYITICNGKEKFFTGGEFVRLGNERIVLSKGNSEWSFPTKIRDNNNNIIYNSRVFIKINDPSCDIVLDEYIKTIKAQQFVIEKLTLKNKKLYDLLIKKSKNII